MKNIHAVFLEKQIVREAKPISAFSINTSPHYFMHIQVNFSGDSILNVIPFLKYGCMAK